MVEISPRIQRLIVRRFPNQSFNVQYRKGVEITLANALSHVTPLPMEEDGIQLSIIAVNLVTANIQFIQFQQIGLHEETRKDPTIKALSITLAQDGLVNEEELHPHQNFWDELSVKGGLITKSSKLLIPSSLRRKCWNRSMKDIRVWRNAC